MSGDSPLRIAAFGFRSFPPHGGGSGSDTFVLEMLPRLAAMGHQVVAYNRVYPGDPEQDVHRYRGVTVIPFRTIRSKGFDTVVHSSRVVYDIIRHNRADVVHLQNGGNSLFGAVLRLFGKRTYMSQDGNDWERKKWSWYARLYLWLSRYLTAYVHSGVIFDNIYARADFQKKFKRAYHFVPFGADVDYDGSGESVLSELGLEKNGYFLFVGRFVPDKGLQYLMPAFRAVQTGKKLVVVGGSPNPSPFEDEIRAAGSADTRVVFPGFLWGAKTQALMKNAYAYVQPSNLEGLSPVILEAAFLGAPIICTDIVQNHYSMKDAALYFRKGDPDDLARVLQRAVDAEGDIKALAAQGQAQVARDFSWDKVVADHVRIFSGAPPADVR